MYRRRCKVRRARSALLLVILCLSGCTSISPESEMYPGAWPELVPIGEARCTLPEGVFENVAALSSYEYADGYHYPPPTLAGVFGAALATRDITHVRLEPLPRGGLRVTGFGVESDQELQLAEVVLEKSRLRCHEGRRFIATDATQWGWDGLQDGYDPTLMAAYLAGTFGMMMPMSQWWNFVVATTVDGSLALRRLNMESAVMFMALYGRSAMDDDWFLYPPTDAGRAVDRAKATRQVAAEDAVEASVPASGIVVDCADRSQSSTALFESGEAAFLQKSYEAAFPCFSAAAEHPQAAHKGAMWYLCVMYEQGWGVEKDLASAEDWCRRAQAKTVR